MAGKASNTMEEVGTPNPPAISSRKLPFAEGEDCLAKHLETCYRTGGHGVAPTTCVTLPGSAGPEPNSDHAASGGVGRITNG